MSQVYFSWGGGAANCFQVSSVYNFIVPVILLQNHSILMWFNFPLLLFSWGGGGNGNILPEQKHKNSVLSTSPKCLEVLIICNLCGCSISSLSHSGNRPPLWSQHFHSSRSQPQPAAVAFGASHIGSFSRPISLARLAPPVHWSEIVEGTHFDW